MYKMPYFTEHDQEMVLQFMKEHAFVTLVAHDGKQSVATQIPVLIVEKEGRLYLQAHIMRNTDHHKALDGNQEVLILFQGPHCYVSSSWYSEKAGATWNYQTVHVRGTATLLDDEATIGILDRLTEHYERDQELPLYTSAMPEGYIYKLVKAIVGLEIAVTDIYPIFKLSQNRDEISYDNIIKHLSTSDDTDAHKIAEEMIKRRWPLFQKGA